MVKRPRRRTVNRAERVGPTPETKAKLSTDVLQKYHKSQHLSVEQYNNGLEIRQVADFMRAAKGKSMETVDGTRAPQDWFENLNDGELKLWRFRWIPWRKEILNSHPRPLSGQQWADVMDAFVIDNQEVIPIANSNNISPSMVMRRVTIGLSLWTV